MWADYRSVRGTRQARIEQTDAASDRRLSRIAQPAPIEVSVGQVLDDEVDQRVVESGGHPPLRAFDPALQAIPRSLPRGGCNVTDVVAVNTGIDAFLGSPPKMFGLGAAL
jgi:hypothetical protein